MIIAARDEAERIGATIAALQRALPRAELYVADDASRDRTAELARRHGARVVATGRHAGKGAAMSAAAATALEHARSQGALDGVFLLCDGDLGDSAGELAALIDALERRRADLAIGAFARSPGGGFGLALSYARRAARAQGLRLSAPMSGQRALRAEALQALLPFAEGYGMELGMTIDAARAGLSICELALPLSHRVRGRTPTGFAHRAAQLRDMARAVRARRT